jgi:hypothetical protein
MDPGLIVAVAVETVLIVYAITTGSSGDGGHDCGAS